MNTAIIYCVASKHIFSFEWLSCPNVAHLLCTLNVGSRADLGLLLCVLLHWFLITHCLRQSGTVQFMLIDQVEGTASCMHQAIATKLRHVAVPRVAPQLVYWDAVKAAWTGAVPFILNDEMSKGIFENYVYHKCCFRKKKKTAGARLLGCLVSGNVIANIVTLGLAYS